MNIPSQISTRQVCTVELPSASPGTHRQLDFIHYGTPGQGPKAYLQAALHADEIPGLLVLHKLIRLLNAADARGEISGHIVVVPVANPVGSSQQLLGELSGRYDHASGRNFNRDYPALADAIAERIGAHLGADAGQNTRLIRNTALQMLEEEQPLEPSRVMKHALMRNAVDADSFQLRFQPINRIDTGVTTHHEVLLRLRGDDGKLMSPDAFLPSAVRFGLMSEIDLWAIRNAAEAYAQHVKDCPQLRLSINLSANAFENDDLAGFVSDVFEKNNVPPTHIIFEITESLAVRRPKHVERQIMELRRLGCELALDDFGTGYSSFSYLQKLHFDYIKIDGSFVHDITNNPVDQKMIKLIAEIGREASMQTVAEYVQNAQSLELLGELGVDLAQGFFVGRPTKRPLFKSTPISLSSQRIKRSNQ